MVEALRREETNRGLTFEYCLITARHQHEPRASEQKWEQGDIMSLDSGGNYHGYIGDVCRMAIQGEPDAELQDLLGEIEAIQRAAMKPIAPAPWGARFTPPPSRWCSDPSTTIIWNFWRTAWGWSATRRRG